ncbi:MAG: lysozyme inhibitor LprI family protein [Phormidesmis sp.]
MTYQFSARSIAWIGGLLLIGVCACTPAVEGEDASRSEQTLSDQTGEKVATTSQSESSKESESSAESGEGISLELQGDELQGDAKKTPPDQLPPDQLPSNQLSTDQQTDQDFCADPVTQLDFTLCARQAYEQTDQALNQVYQALSDQLSNTAAELLTDTELAWIDFRDQECDFISSQFAGGSIEPSVRLECLASRSRTRSEELLQNKQRSSLEPANYSTADAELNSSYQTLLNVLDTAETAEMKTVQLTWLDYRDRNCSFESRYSPEAVSEEQCLARMSMTRTLELQDIIEQRSL